MRGGRAVVGADRRGREGDRAKYEFLSGCSFPQPTSQWDTAFLNSSFPVLGNGFNYYRRFQEVKRTVTAVRA